MGTRAQGDIGEASAIQWLTTKGLLVAIPFGHSPDWDLAFESRFGLSRVQVKTSVCRQGDRWRVQLCTRGGNQSWNGLVKRLDATRCDYVFAHVGDGRRWFIPVDCLEANTAVFLGGPKYGGFEVERGAALTTDAVHSGL